MDFHTKFNLGDTVYQVNSYVKPEQIKCKACDGKGRIEVNGNTFTCNSCHGYGSDTFYPVKQWHINDGIGEIGKVAVACYGEKWISDGNKEYCERYMLDISGVGSGTIYYGEDLFKTYEEASAECDKRNIDSK